MVGVRFRFGWVGPVLGVSPADLFRGECGLQECGPRSAGLFDRLRGCSTVRESLDAVVGGLAERAAGLRADRSSERARRAAALFSGVDEAGDATVARVARRLGVSDRTLHRDVLAATGLPPQTLARILRFRRAVAGLRSAAPPSLAALAAGCGYADQSHLSREVRHFAGLPPSALAARGGEFLV